MAQRTLPSTRKTSSTRAKPIVLERASRAAARKKSSDGLPTFLIIGAQKCGTTSLHRYLSSHPQVFVAQTKELDFFVEEKMWGRGLDWYRSQFQDAGNAIAIGEASPSYTCFPHFAGVPQRIAALIPDVRLIYLVRDPIDRLRSAYRHGLSAGMETLPISEALLQQTRYTDLGRYALQLEQFEQHFDRSQILVMTTEDLQSDRERVVTRALDFIGVDSTWRPADLKTRLNTAEHRPTKPTALWRQLGRYVIKHPRSGKAIVKGLGRFGDTRLARRPIADYEMVIDDDLRARVNGLMRPEIERLARWMEPSFDGWGLLDRV